MWKVISPRCARETATVLQQTLNEFFPKEETLILNWGNSYIGNTPNEQVFGNKTSSVFRSVNKQEFFKLCKSLGTVPAVTQWEGPCFQHHANLQDGQGVKFVDKEEDFIPGILSTKQIKGVEYRVFFCYDGPMHIFKKVKLDRESPSSSIQNSVNGYGYEKNSKTLKTIPKLRELLISDTIKVKNKLELSYGAIDFILENTTHNLYILESNSAPTIFDEGVMYSFADTINKQFGE